VVLDFRQRESLRRRHLPERVRVLFIGESPPASGRFFYHRDSGLYRATRDVFQSVDPSIRDELFLAKFRDLGCYLVDLCPEPVDRLDARSRRNACANSEASLSITIARLNPAMIITVVRSIEGNVTNAAARVNWNGVMVQLPYPGRWSHPKQTFSEELRPIIAPLVSIQM
jgi:hypothetical protein